MKEVAEVTVSLGTATGLALVVGAICMGVAVVVAVIVRITRRDR